MADDSSNGGCDPGFWGPNCGQPCPANCLDGTCNAIGLCNSCLPGYKDFKCETKCDPGTFGPDCGERCSFHCEVLECHHITGECACKSGFKLPRCLEGCDITTWGKNCSLTCSSGCVDQDCDSSNGLCQHGCVTGFVGEFCDEPCPSGTYGDDCITPCSVQCMDSICDHVTGICQACPEGYKGQFCDTPCDPGTYGSRCTKKCSPQCGGTNSGCKSTDGSCTEGCDDGYRGPRCDQKCLEGMFGQNCSQSCSEFCLPPTVGNFPCDHVTGFCPQGCSETHKGPACLTQVPTSSLLMGGIAGGIVVGIIVVIALLIAIIVFRRRKTTAKSATPVIVEENGNVRSLASYSNINHAYLHDEKAYIDDEDEASDVGISIATESDSERDKGEKNKKSPDVTLTRIGSRDLASCLEKWRANPVPLYEQFESLPKGLTSSADTAVSTPNKSKNRYRNICAYDHSRVKLNIIDGDPNSDYVNANYVEAYDGQSKYIASQGPNAANLNDFLRMLWEKRVTTVVMLTNTHEGGKPKCEQYWPDSGEKKYGGVTVTLLSTRRTADYIVRTLQLAKEGRKIQLTQHHFTSWPDKGVPSSPWPLVDFYMVVRLHLASQPSDLPTVVHCSAGIGRTGTYIALDKLLHEAADTQSLDFYSCVKNLRHARVNMVQTPEQYMFLHESVLVGVAVAGSLHGKHSLSDVITELNKTTAEGTSKMAFEFKRLSSCQAKIDEDDFKDGRENDNIAKNRYYNILPKDSHRPFLTCSSTSSNDYINAVFLPGYRKQRQYVVTQMPLASTVLDLWKLVGEYPVSTIVLFPATPTTIGDTAPEFLPEEGQTSVFGSYKVTGRSSTQQDRYQESFLFMVKSKRLSFGRNGKTLHVLKCEESNPGPDLLVSLAQAAIFGVSDKQLEEGLILVVCRTGAELSGVFVALTQLVQRLGECAVSVPTVVGHLRTIRPQLVSTLEQYQTVYEALKLFAVNSSIYTNMEMQVPPKPQRKPGKDTSKNDDNKDRKSKKKDKEKKKDTSDDSSAANGSTSGAANGSTNGATAKGSSTGTGKELSNGVSKGNATNGDGRGKGSVNGVDGGGEENDNKTIEKGHVDAKMSPKTHVWFRV